MTDQIAALMPFFRVTDWMTLAGRGLVAVTTMDRDRTRTSVQHDLIGHTVALTMLPGVEGESGLYKIKGVEMFCIENQREGIGIGLLVEKVDGWPGPKCSCGLEEGWHKPGLVETHAFDPAAVIGAPGEAKPE